jgi:methionyl-tRNA synthetase
LKKENKISEMNEALAQALESVRIIALMLCAFMPQSSAKFFDLLAVEEKDRNFSALKNSLKVGHKINEPKAVFPRLEAAK